MAKLTIKSGDLPARILELKLGPNRLGRDPRNDFYLDHPTVSARHCEIGLDNDGVSVRDLDSTNGTFIDGQPVTWAMLQPGQVLKIGSVELELDTAWVQISLPPMAVEPPPGPTFLSDGRPACLHHRDQLAAWICVHCRLHFCEPCIHTVYRVGGQPLKLCPECSRPSEPVKIRLEEDSGARNPVSKAKAGLASLFKKFMKPFRR